MKRIFIRTDGNSILGLGHVIRCCSIAEALKEKNVFCYFLVADAISAVAVQEQGFRVYQLNSSWNDLEQEKDIMIKIIQKEKIKLLFIDSYYVSKRYLETLRKYTKVAYLTGMNDFLYPVDILINYHIYANQLGYQKQYNSDTKLVLGCHYVPLRKEFSIPQRYDPDKEAIFVTTGATDPYYIVPELLKILQKTKYGEWDYHIILGKYYEDNEVKEIKRLQYSSNFFLYQNIQDMAEIMGKCSIAVSAAGFTLYELCACGIPTITFAFADNQLYSINAFSQQRIMESIGDIRKNVKDGVRKIVQKIWEYDIDKKLLIEKSILMKKCIDGNGAQHLSDLLFYELNNIIDKKGENS